ncbi:MAG TPA: SH3-like domain-containing protein [Roseiarcus sp.]|nr:SH3-like domain-containing protein [Roseiarcus sp.]
MPADKAAEARFRAGDRVTVRESYPLGHVRTPFYARGKVGFIERLCGFYPNPEERAYGRSGLPKEPLYRVRFRQSDLWPNYAGAVGDTVDIEIYQHWLEART